MWRETFQNWRESKFGPRVHWARYNAANGKKLCELVLLSKKKFHANFNVGIISGIFGLVKLMEVGTSDHITLIYVYCPNSHFAELI